MNRMVKSNLKPVFKNFNVKPEFPISTSFNLKPEFPISKSFNVKPEFPISKSVLDISTSFKPKPVLDISTSFRIKPWGVHTSIDCNYCNKSLITSENHIRNYILELCDKIKIKQFGDCNIIKNNKEGYSMSHLSKNSNISGHFIYENDKIFIDLFSCKEYNSYEVIEFTRKYFEAKTYIYNITNRY